MNRQSELHHIQRAIILSLAMRSPLSFTELQPPRLPNNTFSYHLKKLIDRGYVEHVGNRYIPTRKALKVVAAIPNQKARTTSPTPITMFYVTNLDGEVLLLNRNYAPFQGWYGLPSGTIHLGESLDEAAERELYEKSGLRASGDLTPAGILDFQYREEATGDVFAHALAFLYEYRYDGDETLIDDKMNRFGQLSWSKLGRQHILSEVLAAKDIVESGAFTKKTVQFIEPSHLPVLSLEQVAYSILPNMNTEIS